MASFGEITISLPVDPDIEEFDSFAKRRPQTGDRAALREFAITLLEKYEQVFRTRRIRANGARAYREDIGEIPSGSRTPALITPDDLRGILVALETVIDPRSPNLTQQISSRIEMVIKGMRLLVALYEITQNTGAVVEEAQALARPVRTSKAEETMLSGLPFDQQCVELFHRIIELEMRVRQSENPQLFAAAKAKFNAVAGREFLSVIAAFRLNVPPVPEYAAVELFNLLLHRLVEFQGQGQDTAGALSQLAFDLDGKNAPDYTSRRTVISRFGRSR